MFQVWSRNPLRGKTCATFTPVLLSLVLLNRQLKS